MERSYQDLPLKLEKLDALIGDFFTLNPDVALIERKDQGRTHVITYGCKGQPDAMVILHLKKGGVTTVQYKTGKNQRLGCRLADFLYENTDHEDSKAVYVSLRNFSPENMEILIQSIAGDEDGAAFSITEHNDNVHSVRYEIISVKYQDRLNLTYFASKQSLLIQGKRLYCYRTVAYYSSILLDENSLCSVLSCREVEPSVIASRGDSETHLATTLYPISFYRMNETYRKLIVSSYCLSLSNPDLPDYSMLVYSELRVLEGIVKQTLALHGLHTTTAGDTAIGTYFDLDSSVTIKAQYRSSFATVGSTSSAAIITALEECFSFYRRQRHSLFHMTELPEMARVISRSAEATQLSQEIARRIEDLFRVCDKLQP
ncbi:type II toxin-antitoxin system RnlA family toxin [Serratia ureilytica]|uniref:type II toxin-antitoxin system RnlA family toxin n=1 Tax=Serratia ureilytica TaxID=300181 RepID=UPI0018692F6F|nr:type II toxin-antitoxin system RnlA family toxin [Serratia ureilytica]